MTLAFLVLTPIIVMLSRGYRLDLAQRRFVQTGAIFLKTNPTEITLWLDGKGKNFKRSTLLYNGILLSNLIPQQHSLAAWSDDEHFDWKKNLTVEPLLVAKATRVVLPWRKPEITQTPISSSTPVFSRALKNGQILYSLDGRRLYSFKTLPALYSQILTASTPLPTRKQSLRFCLLLLNKIFSFYPKTKVF